MACGTGLVGGASSSVPRAALLMGPVGSTRVAEVRGHLVCGSLCVPPCWTQTCAPKTSACHSHSSRLTFLMGEEQNPFRRLLAPYHVPRLCYLPWQRDRRLAQQLGVTCFSGELCVGQGSEEQDRWDKYALIDLL